MKAPGEKFAQKRAGTLSGTGTAGALAILIGYALHSQGVDAPGYVLDAGMAVLGSIGGLAGAAIDKWLSRDQ